MGGMEHLINVYASRTAKGSIASFMGYCNVQPHEAEHALVEGLWLVSSRGLSPALVVIKQGGNPRSSIKDVSQGLTWSESNGNSIHMSQIQRANLRPAACLCVICRSFQ